MNYEAVYVHNFNICLTQGLGFVLDNRLKMSVNYWHLLNAKSEKSAMIMHMA